MAVKNLSTRVAIIGRGAKCRGGSSAVDKSAYISRTTMYSEYDGTTYYPKYTEDLVHNEVMLPVNAPAEYSDPSVLWNSVEMRESKSAKAQLARSYKINLPNEWSYELAIEVMRDYVKRNFVDDGMCAQFAIHDSENPNTHQRNLHCHIMLTMRPILEGGSWGDKQKKIYALDADGNKIRKKNGQYKCTTQDVTGWNSRENARKWRKDLADTINAVNDKNGLRENFWEHRSFAEQGLDTIPQIHLGEKASALERAGILTERGNVNRRIMEQNKAILTAKMLVAKAEEQLQKLVNSKPVEAVRNTANEVLDMIRAVVGKKGRLELPVIKSKYLRKISQRQALQEQERMERFVVANQIESFEQLQEFKDRQKKTWADEEDFVRRLYKQVLASDVYKEWMSDNCETTFEEDRDFWRRLYRSVFVENEDLDQILEDKSLYWNDDRFIVDTFVMKTIKRFSPKGGSRQPLLPEFKDEEDREFATRLFRASLLGSENYRMMVSQMLHNWDLNRLALMDLIIMQTALAEICTFPNIPVSVTINEYVEIAKMYSTPQSGRYVNGMLDAIARKLVEEGKIRKMMSEPRASDEQAEAEETASETDE